MFNNATFINEGIKKLEESKVAKLSSPKKTYPLENNKPTQGGILESPQNEDKELIQGDISIASKNKFSKYL